MLSHISAEAFTGHRIVKAFGTEAAEASQVRAGRRTICIRTNMKVTAALAGLPPLMELLGGFGDGRRAVVRQPRDRRRPADAWRVHCRSSPRCS